MLIADRWSGAVVALLMHTLVVGCAASTKVSTAPGQGSTEKRDTRIVQEGCPLDSKGAQKDDLNGDGAAEITRVNQGGREVCRAVDLNGDRIIDRWSYFDERGQLRREETDFDRDGRIDEINEYKGGVKVTSMRATTLAGKLDTWHYYKGGKLTRTERDSNGDAIIDQWWEYPDPEKPECPVVVSDENGDGKPDPDARVKICDEKPAPVRPPPKPKKKDDKPKPPDARPTDGADGKPADGKGSEGEGDMGAGSGGGGQ